MASRQPDIQERLREGIEAARRGDRVNARRLLQQVLILDRDNEAALMWMASVVDTLAERRAFLERALKVNPNNTRAREALQRMGVNVGAARSADTDDTARPRSTTRRGANNPYLFAAAVVAALTIGIIAVILLTNAPPAAPTSNAAQATLVAILEPTGERPTPVGPPTQTPFIGVIVTLDPNQIVLPPTFTPTETPEPTATFTPTATFIPPQTYQLVFGAFAGAAEYPGLYRSRASGAGLETLGNPVDGYFDLAYSPDGSEIAFVRLVPNEGGETPMVPQLFIAPVDDPSQAVQVTTLGSPDLTHPTWSPDGQRLVFVSAEDGDNDLWIIDRDGENLRQLTVNTASDTTPDFSPDGTRIVFASDADSPGFSEIYELNLANNRITRLSDEAGNNYDPVYSPDGTRIAFISTQGGDPDIYIMDADGQRKFLLTIDDAGAEDRWPEFTPDGAYIGFISNRANMVFSLYLLNLRNNEVMQIIESDDEVQSLSFNPTIPSVR